MSDGLIIDSFAGGGGARGELIGLITDHQSTRISEDCRVNSAEKILLAIHAAGFAVVRTNQLTDDQIEAMDNFGDEYAAGQIGGRNDYWNAFLAIIEPTLASRSGESKLRRRS